MGISGCLFCTKCVCHSEDWGAGGRKGQGSLVGHIQFDPLNDPEGKIEFSFLS